MRSDVLGCMLGCGGMVRQTDRHHPTRGMASIFFFCWVGLAGAVAVFFFGENEYAKQAREDGRGTQQQRWRFVLWTRLRAQLIFFICLFTSSCTWIPPFLSCPSGSSSRRCFNIFFLRIVAFSKDMAVVLPSSPGFIPTRSSQTRSSTNLFIILLPFLVSSCHLGFGFVSVSLHGGLSCFADRCRGRFCVCVCGGQGGGSGDG